MTKAELIEEVSRVVEMTRKDSEVIVEAIFDSVVRALRSGDKIEIRGFGSFRTRQRQPRVGRNPKTGARVEVPAKRIPYFKPSKELKDLVNGGGTAAPEAAPDVDDGLPVEPVEIPLRLLGARPHQNRAGACFAPKRPRPTTARTWWCCAAEHNFILLNLYPYTSGHLMIAPYAHVASLQDAEPAALEEMMRLAATRRHGSAPVV